MKFMAPFENHSMFGNESERPLLQVQLGAFLYPYFGILGRSTERRENCDIRIEPNPIVAPVTGRDHAAI